MAVACAVPVFRYALDRWAPDAYRLEASATALRTGPAAADLRGDNGVRLNILALPQPDESGNRAVLRFPSETGDNSEAWSGELTADAYRQLTESPARAQIAHRLLGGDSAVWILVESGNREADERIAKVLAEQIAIAEKMPLPTTRPNDPESQIAPGPKMQVKFSLLRVSRNAPDETFFLTSLAGPGGLATLSKEEPFAAAVFGRGRVLGAWSPAKLTPELITQASRFMLGACSCEAKHLNPGWDLLMRVNWDAELEKAAAANPHPNGDSTTRPVAVETVTYQPAAAAPTQPLPDFSGFALIMGIVPAIFVVGGSILAVGVAYLLVRRRV
jgi:hypothetical protein